MRARAHSARPRLRRARSHAGLSARNPLRSPRAWRSTRLMRTHWFSPACARPGTWHPRLKANKPVPTSRPVARLRLRCGVRSTPRPRPCCDNSGMSKNSSSVCRACSVRASRLSKAWLRCRRGCRRLKRNPRSRAGVGLRCWLWWLGQAWVHGFCTAGAFAVVASRRPPGGAQRPDSLPSTCLKAKTRTAGHTWTTSRTRATTCWGPSLSRRRMSDCHRHPLRAIDSQRHRCSTRRRLGRP